MQIQSINNSQNFKSRMFLPNGNQIKAFTLLEQLEGVDKMANIGSPKTDFFIKSFESKQFAGTYENYVKVKVYNPLFGFVSFVQNLCHKTNSPVSDTIDELRLLDYLTSFNQCEQLEDKALQIAIIEELKKRSANFSIYNDDITSLMPTNVLKSMLEETQPAEHGFSPERVEQFKKIAKIIQTNLIDNFKVQE